MSDEVQKWYAIINRRPLPNPVPAEDYHLVVLASDYDAAVSRAEKAEARIHLLQQHLETTTADRNRWSSRAGEAEDRIVDLGNRCILAEAERDGLAEPVEERQGIDCGRPGCSKPGGILQHHGFGKCVERRGTTRHDARGRRQYDPRVTIYTASDRRRAQRRKP